TTPPASDAVPLTVTGDPLATVAPAAGAVTAEAGGVASVEAVAGTRPDCRVVGWTPMSARRLTVACCMVRWGVTGPQCGTLAGPRTSRPQAHCTVAALNTRAPLAARYRVGL